MVVEALRAQSEAKGVSVVAIKRYILAKYPSVDPIRLRYLLKQALTRGLNRGLLVRPHSSSSAVGATGRFKLAPEKLQQKEGQEEAGGGPAPKPGRKGTARAPRAPVAGAQQQDAAEDKLAAVKQKAKPRKAQQPAAAKPRTDGMKPPGAGGHPQAPSKGHSGPSTAPATEDAERSKGSAEGKRTRKAPAGKSKDKAPKGAQRDAPKAKGNQGKVKKSRVTPETGQEKPKPQKAAPTMDSNAA